MPRLDLNDLLTDPDFSSPFSVIRQSVTVGANGRATTVEEPIPDLVGVITPGDSGDLLRDDDRVTTSRVITVTTAFMLRGSGPNFIADDIVYDGGRYVVKAVKLWNRLGRGWTRAVAVSATTADPPASNA